MQFLRLPSAKVLQVNTPLVTVVATLRLQVVLALFRPADPHLDDGDGKPFNIVPFGRLDELVGKGDALDSRNGLVGFFLLSMTRQRRQACDFLSTFVTFG
jgi:hypothetical protein